jgi:hypothetical protein
MNEFKSGLGICKVNKYDDKIIKHLKISLKWN